MVIMGNSICINIGCSRETKVSNQKNNPGFMEGLADLEKKLAYEKVLPLQAALFSLWTLLLPLKTLLLLPHWMIRVMRVSTKLER